MALTGNLVFAGCQLLMLVSLAQLSTTVQVGQFGLALAVTAPAYFVANLKIRQVAITDVGNDFLFGHYVALRYLSTTLTWAIFTSWSLAFSNWVLLGVATMKALEMLSDTFYAAPHKSARLRGITIALSARGLASTGAFALTLWLGEGLAPALGACSAVYAVALIGDAFLARRYEDIRPVFEPARLRSLLSITLPLGIAMASASLSSMIPRYILDWWHGETSVAFFSVSVYFLTVGGVALNAIAQAYSPHLAALHHADDFRGFHRALTRIRVRALLLALATVTGALLLGKWALTLLFGPEYGAAYGALVLLACSTIPSYVAVFSGTALNAMRRFRSPLPITLISATIVLLTAIPLAQQWGVEGAAVAVIAGASSELLLYTIALRHARRSAFSDVQDH